MKKNLFLFLLYFLWHGFFSYALADQHFPQPTGYINDYAHLLTPEQANNLNQQLRAFDQKTSNQIVVATFTSLNGNSLEDFSVHLAQAWKIGTKQHDNGVLVLIIKDSHDIRIEVGYGLEGVLTDATSSMIIQHDIVPSFKQGDFAQGIQNGVTAIMLATQGEYKGSGEMGSASNSNGFLFFVLLFLLLHIIAASFRYNRIRGTSEDRGWWTFLLFLLLSNGSGRGGRSDNDDDSFSGGGGSFGGGGASGKW